MNIITQNIIESKPAMDCITSFCNRFVTSGVLSRCGIKKLADIEEQSKPLEYVIPDGFDVGHDKLTAGKQDGITAIDSEKKKNPLCVAARKLFLDYMFVFLLNFSIFRLFKSGMYFGDYKKDTLYRLLQIKGAKWEQLELLVAASVIADVEKDTTDNHVNVLIFDDSLYRRAGNGCGTQLCGKVYDHNDRKLRIGYRMMTGAWSNGELTIPFSQTLLTSNNPKFQVGIFDLPDGRTVEGKRARRALVKGTDTVIRMVEKAQSVDIPFDYILFDTWFSKPVQLIELKNIGVDVIAMVSKSKTRFNVYDPKTDAVAPLDVKEIFNRYKKRPGKSRYLLSVTGTVTKDGNTIDVKLVFARNRNNRKEWVCFVCTKKDLDEQSILSIYTTRWNIEVYFKTIKSHIRLTSECHSTKYDALTAHMVIVAIRYMALALDAYRHTDPRTITDLFEMAKREVINQMINSALTVIIDCLFEVVREMFHPTKEQMEKMYILFYEKLPTYWKNRFNDPAMAA